MSDPIAAANTLAVALDTLRDELAESNAQANARLDAQTAYGRRNRSMIWGLVASLVFHVVLTAVLIVVAVKTNEANDKATRTHDQQVSTCLSTNAARANNRELWAELFKLTPPPQTDVQKERLDKFKAIVEKTFAPRDCSKI